MNLTTLNMTTLDGGVIIKKGEGGGSMPPSGGESAMEYWDITAAPDEIDEIAQFATLLKFINKEFKDIASIYGLTLSNITPIGVAIDMNAKLVNRGIVMTVNELFKVLGFPPFDSIGWVRLTKEQFYSLE